MKQAMNKKQLLEALMLEEYTGHNANIDHTALIIVGGKEIRVVAYAVSCTKKQLIKAKVDSAKASGHIPVDVNVTIKES